MHILPHASLSVGLLLTLITGCRHDAIPPAADHDTLITLSQTLTRLDDRLDGKSALPELQTRARLHHTLTPKPTPHAPVPLAEVVQWLQSSSRDFGSPFIPPLERGIRFIAKHPANALSISFPPPPPPTLTADVHNSYANFQSLYETLLQLHCPIQIRSNCVILLLPTEGIPALAPEKPQDVIARAILETRNSLDALHDDLKTVARILLLPLPPAIPAAQTQDIDDLTRHYNQTLARVAALLDDVPHPTIAALKKQSASSPLHNAILHQLLAMQVRARLHRIVIPQLTFRHTDTLPDAIGLLKQASRDYDLPAVPLSQRGVSFILQTATGDHPTMAEISETRITLHDALHLICDTTGYSFKIDGGLIMLTPPSP